MAGMSSVASFPSGSMLSINEAGLSAQSTQPRSSGQIKNPGLVDKLLFTVGLKTEKGKRAYRLARLERNEAKLVRDARYIVLTAEASLSRRATIDRNTVKEVGAEVNKFALRAEKIQSFTDIRADGMNAAMSEIHGTDEVPTKKIILKALARALDGRGDLTKDAVVDLMAGSVDGRGSEDAQNFRENLVAYGNKSSNMYLPGVKAQVIDAFSSVREDSALRQMLTGEKLDFKKVMILGEQVRAEKQVSQPLSGRFATKEPAPSQSFPSYLGAQDAQSLNESVADGSLPRPMPVFRPIKQQLSPTEESCARVVAQMSSSQRAQLRAEVAGKFREVIEHSAQPAEKQNLLNGTSVIVRALEETQQAAKNAFGRYKVSMHHQDLKSLSTTFADRIPFIKKSWHRGFFKAEAAVMKDYRAVCDKVVSNSRKAFGTFKDEGVETRHKYYETLAKEIAQQFGESLAPTKSKKGAQPDLYNVQDRVYRALRNADKKQAYIESQAAAKKAAVASKANTKQSPVPSKVDAKQVTVQSRADAPQTPVKLRAAAQEARTSLNMEVQRGVTQFLAERSPVKAQLPDVVYEQVPQRDDTLAPVAQPLVEASADQVRYEVPKKKSIEKRGFIANEESSDSGVESGAETDYSVVPLELDSDTNTDLESNAASSPTSTHGSSGTDSVDDGEYSTIDDLAPVKPASIFDDEPWPALPEQVAKQVIADMAAALPESKPVLNKVYINKNALAAGNRA